MSTKPPAEYPLERVTLTICSACLDGIGGECHTPGCAFWMSDVPDVPLRSKVIRRRNISLWKDENDAATEATDR